MESRGNYQVWRSQLLKESYAFEQKWQVMWAFGQLFTDSEGMEYKSLALIWLRL